MVVCTRDIVDTVVFWSFWLVTCIDMSVVVWSCSVVVSVVSSHLISLCGGKCSLWSLVGWSHVVTYNTVFARVISWRDTKYYIWLFHLVTLQKLFCERLTLRPFHLVTLWTVLSSMWTYMFLTAHNSLNFMTSNPRYNWLSCASVWMSMRQYSSSYKTRFSYRRHVRLNLRLFVQRRAKPTIPLLLSCVACILRSVLYMVI